MNRKKTNWIAVISIVLSIVLLLAMALCMPYDPDMGWHLRNGADILANMSFPIGDTYSWSMAGYPWIPHEWLTDIIMYIIHSWAGLWGLVVTFMLLIAGIFYFAAGIRPTNRFSRIVIAIIALLVSWNVIGVRPQMLTLLGVAVILYLLFNLRNNPKSKLIYFMPLVFLLWANMHGGFPIAFVIIALFVIGEFIRRVLLGKARKKITTGLLSITDIWKLVGVSCLGLLATLINPSGWRVYQELLQTFGDRGILNQIAEWLGVNLFYGASYNLAILSLLILVLLFVNRFRVDITKLIMVVVIFFFSITSWRHVPIFAIVAIPLLAEQIDYLIGRDIKIMFQQWMAPALLALMILAIGNNYFAAAVPALSSDAGYGKYFNYPYGVVEYLKEHPKDRKMLNEYNWGGYLIWKLPEVRVFIDGRMAIWKWNGVEIFDEYKTLLGIDKKKALAGIKEWGVDTIFTTPTHPINYYILSADEPWERAYNDSSFVLWERR